jgi:hypothetical protein
VGDGRRELEGKEEKKRKGAAAKRGKEEMEWEKNEEKQQPKKGKGVKERRGQCDKYCYRARLAVQILSVNTSDLEDVKVINVKFTCCCGIPVAEAQRFGRAAN